MLPAIIGGAASVIGGIFGNSAARKAAARARKEAKRLGKKLDDLVENRQDIINPYAGITSTADYISNPMANLSVATQATELQMEQTDIALANTLDTIRATGASAGGATALAQAALQSKRNIAASIEAQEATNEKLRAQGEERVQGMKISEMQRLQQAEAAGKEFQFRVREGRQQQEIDRTASLMAQAQAAAGQAQADATSAITGAIGGIVSIAGAALGPSSSTDTT